MLSKIKKILGKIEDFPLTFSQWLLAFSAIVILRLFGENFLSGFSDKSTEFFVGSALVTFLFFLFAYLLILLFLRLFLGVAIEKAANVLLGGYFIIIIPPLVDHLVCRSKSCWSFYAFDNLSGLARRFVTFFGDSPTLGITYGVRLEVALAVVFLGIYAYLKTNKLLKAAFCALGSYAILFVLGSFPSWIGYILLAPSKKIFSIEGFDIAGIFLAPVRIFSFESTDVLNALNMKMNLVYGFLVAMLAVFVYWFWFRRKFFAIAKNVRWVQITIHAGLILTGAGLGAFYFPANVPHLRDQPLADTFFSFLALANLVLAAVFSWLASIFLNDEVDLEIDKVTNARRPLAQGVAGVADYRNLFLAGLVISFLLALSVGMKFFLLLIVYQVISWIYSAWPFRLKRFPVVATGLSALALSLLFLSGFMLLADNRDITAFPPKLFWLLIIAFAVSLPIKDLKDIAGDKKDGIWTIPVILGESWARFAIGCGIFISYALSVVWLNAKILFIPAMVLGALSFWILQAKKISPRKVHIWVFGLLFLYVVLISYLLFYPAIKLS